VGFFMITGFILASNGPHSIIIASNTLYSTENANYINRRIKSFVLSIILVILLVFIIVVLGFGNMIVKAIMDMDFLKNISDNLYFIFVLLKWPIAFILIFFTIKVIYTIAPDMNIRSKDVNIGSLFTTLCFMLATAVYSYYVTNFANYDIFYGSLSNIIILMMWIYILSYVLVLGIAINALYYQMAKKGLHNLELKNPQ
ncbi:MAG: YihY/virulence factor BrkB family protein, partial [Bacilli bacterium]|nr:YihY/virulence factor BrkB family protein [Bacilli bacterium]